MIWSYLVIKERTSKAWERSWRWRGPARTFGSRWKSKSVRLRFSFGLQKQPVLKRTPMSHTESDLDVLYMDEKIISRSFQWHRFQAQILPESMEIIYTSWHSEFVPVLQRRLLVFWAVYRVRPHSGRIQGVLHDPRDFISSCHILVRVWVLLKLF
jgi:hypothetical protein